MITRSALSAPARSSLYGHGLLGSAAEATTSPQQTLGDNHNIVSCSTDQIGLSAADVGNSFSILVEIGQFPELADRLQQGLLNEIFLGRLMLPPQGFASGTGARASTTRSRVPERSGAKPRADQPDEKPLSAGITSRRQSLAAAHDLRPWPDPRLGEGRRACYRPRRWVAILAPERFTFLAAQSRSRGRRNLPETTLDRSSKIMSTTFADLGVSPAVARALSKRGIDSPFPVQQLVIEDVLAGRDVLVQSPTGSGKTLAFGLPLVERVAADARRPAALILAPTRELARQIVDELDSIARVRALKVEVVYGGVGIQPQIRSAPKAHILVATPGRLEDLLERRALTLSHIRTLVLDEADRMLDMGFKPAVDRIVRQIPKQRQTLFFSATLEGAAGKLADAYTTDARRHVNAPKHDPKAAIEHRFVQASSQGAKVDLLVAELANDERGRTLVFVRTKRGADRLVKKLSAEKVHALAMHGDKSQAQRQKALARFDRGDVTVLVATDVAARGIDVPDITHVINFDAPEDGDAYTHRVGRTGRAGASGRGVSFLLGDQAFEMSKIAAGLGLSSEFDRREGKQHGSLPRSDSRQGPQGGRDGGRSHSRNGSGRKTVYSSKQGGGGSTGPKRRRRSGSSRAR